MSQRIIGILLLLGGGLLFIVGMNASRSVADRLSNFFTGQFTDLTVWYLVCGVAMAVGGIVLISSGGKRTAV